MADIIRHKHQQERKKEKMTSTTKKQDTKRTVYIVRDGVNRRFLNQRAYSGRICGIWGRLDESHIFYTKAKAQSCASNINARPSVLRNLSARVVRMRIDR